MSHRHITNVYFRKSCLNCCCCCCCCCCCWALRSSLLSCCGAYSCLLLLRFCNGFPSTAGRYTRTGKQLGFSMKSVPERDQIVLLINAHCAAFEMGRSVSKFILLLLLLLLFCLFVCWFQSVWCNLTEWRSWKRSKTPLKRSPVAAPATPAKLRRSVMAFGFGFGFLALHVNVTEINATTTTTSLSSGHFALLMVLQEAAAMAAVVRRFV